MKNRDFGYLGNAIPINMSAITSFGELDERIGKADGRPTVLEALWDGDTEGWFLILHLYVEKGWLLGKKEEIIYMGTLGYTAAKMMNEWGSRAAEKYGLTFYFPAGDEPDDDCPGWDKRHLAIKCADCGKLIIPRDNSYLPKGICHHCNSKRGQNEKLIKAEPYDDGVTMCLSKDGKYEEIGYSTYFKGLTIAPFINDLVQRRLGNGIINIVTLDTNDISALKKDIEKALASELAEYEMPVLDERKKKFVRLYTVAYKGTEYELMDKFNQSHQKISELIHAFNTAVTAIARDYQYELFFKNGITYRDDSILRFVNFVCKGSASIPDIKARYANVLTDEEVMDTLRKLEQAGCLDIHDSEARITPVGKNIV